MNRSIIITCLSLLMFQSTCVFSQGYLSENEVTLTIVQGKKTFNWFSSKMTTSLDLERSEMNMHIDAVTFLAQADSVKNLQLFAAGCNSIHMTLTLPFNKLDKDVSGRQIFYLQGNLTGCGNNYPINVNVGFQYLDKLLMFDFKLKTEASLIGVTGLKNIDPIVMLHTDNGRILLRSKD